MFRNLKAKLIGAAVVASAALLVSVSAFAAVNTVNITSATTASSVTLSDTAATAPVVTRTDLITINATISAPEADVTILSVDSAIDLANNTINDSDIKYINQETSDENTGACSITFRMPLDAAAGTYAVYVGGENVSDIAVKYLKLAAGTGTYLSGDVTVDEVVDSDDAMYILRYELGLPIAASLNLNMNAGDVTSDGNVDSDDAMYILRYELGLSIPSNITVGQVLNN